MRLTRCLLRYRGSWERGAIIAEDEPKRTCSWEKACVWCGVPLLILGVVAVLVGQLTPVREAVVARRGSLAYLDRKAIAYNQRLELCRLVGLAALCAAALLILLSFLISAYSNPSSQQYSPVFAGPAAASPIPLSGVLTTVQPPTSTVPPRR
ncbi:unnamed protein product [Nezara viridula]|uniref:Uncharacterized protein n=1 Tax=Nezara viridula TaxID=85310 RepID=A0A9P0H9M0_NEZVI|nr:unnamed protein product [Nezara viridula]